MSAITIRQLPEGMKQRLRMRAAAHGRSMEAEARTILLDALAADAAPDLTWVNILIEAGLETPGDPIPIPSDEPATAADFAS